MIHADGMDAKKQVYRLLDEYGIPERHNKHAAWRVNGHLVVITGTKTDDRGWKNKLSEIRRCLRASASEAFGRARCNGKEIYV